jgi:beta-N-acetylhexosaminidase
MNIRQKVGQLILVELPGTQLTDEIAVFIRECHPAALALFGRNLAGPWQTAQFIADLQAIAADAGDAPLLVGIDQEGGQVSHLRYPCTEMPSQMARAAADGAQAARQSAYVLGVEMARLGFNLAFAPVVDINTNPANPVIGTRSFGDDPALVSECGVATIEGLRQAGVLSMAKHFPGHGDTSTDSHLGLPTVTHDRAHLNEIELAPFRAAINAGVDTLCSAHVAFPALDASGVPATLSRLIMTDLLRGELGFKGALFADALVMDAIAKKDSANVPPAALAAIKAGVDCAMILGSLNLQRRVYDALLAAVENGTISEARLDEAVERVQALRLRVTKPNGAFAMPVPEHQKIGREMALKAVTPVRDEAGLLPLKEGDLGVVEFTSGAISPVEHSRNEPLNASTLALLLGHLRPGTHFLALDSRTPDAERLLAEFVAGRENIVVATRNAILDAVQTRLLRQIEASGKPVIQLALRSPYDATLAPGIRTVLATYGDHPQALSAIVDVLLGNAPAQGRLPVKLAS